MEDILQPIVAILISGLFAPLLTQLIERFTGKSPDAPAVRTNLSAEEKRKRRKRNLVIFTYAVFAQLSLFTMFFFLSKWAYFDENYFPTSERELIREGIKKGKDYVIPKMTIRVYSESKAGLPAEIDSCSSNPLNYCMLVSISYEIVALKNFKDQKIFQEYYQALYAYDVLREPGSETQGQDKNPKDVICNYDIITTMEKYQRKTITTRADFLYTVLPATRVFMGDEITDENWDFFYYPNEEDDVIGEVEYQIISRTLQFNTPTPDDAIHLDENRSKHTISTQLLKSKGDCFHFNILTAKIPRLHNKEHFGVKWTWK